MQKPQKGFLPFKIASINTPLYMKIKCVFNTVASNHFNMKVSFLLFFLSLHYIARAEQEKEILIQEIMRFCNDNGHKFLTFLYDQKYPEYVKQLIYKSGRNFCGFCAIKL